MPEHAYWVSTRRGRGRGARPGEYHRLGAIDVVRPASRRFSVPDQPKIPLATTAVVLNDMINMNLVSSDGRTQQIIDDSKIVENTANLIAAARARGMRIVWILIERRADLADQAPPLT